jgi:hypothetical protein
MVAAMKDGYYFFFLVNRNIVMMFQAFSTHVRTHDREGGERTGPRSLILYRSALHKREEREVRVFMWRERKEEFEGVFDWSLYQPVHANAHSHVELDTMSIYVPWVLVQQFNSWTISISSGSLIYNVKLTSHYS